VSGGDASVALREETVSVTPVAVQAPEPTPSPIVIDIPAPTETEQNTADGGPAAAAPLEILPLDVLAPEAMAYLEGRAGRVGVAVAVPDDGIAYVYNGDAQFPMASVAKVPIMLATLGQIDQNGRSLNTYEQELLRQMITVSDNIDAYALWEAAGGADAVVDYLSSIEIEGIIPNQWYWGESLAEAPAMAELLLGLVEGSILTESSTILAMELLEGVHEAQDWGVPSGAVTDTSTAVVGVKNGWYPAADGWRVNSVGYVLSESGQLRYTIAVLSNEQNSLDYGIDTIEGLSQILHSAISN
jgi:hypothetical protein